MLRSDDAKIDDLGHLLRRRQDGCFDRAPACLPPHCASVAVNSSAACTSRPRAWHERPWLKWKAASVSPDGTWLTCMHQLSVAARMIAARAFELSVSCQCMRAASSHVTWLVHGSQQGAGGEG